MRHLFPLKKGNSRLFYVSYFGFDWKKVLYENNRLFEDVWFRQKYGKQMEIDSK